MKSEHKLAEKDFRMKNGTSAGHIFDRSIDVMALIAGVMSAFIMVLLCYMVIMRYIFSKPPAWVIEICEYLLIYITFLSATWLLRQNGHVRVDLFFNWLSPSGQKIVRMLTSVTGSVACTVLTWYGISVTIDNYLRNILSIHTLSVPKWMLYAVIPVGSIFLATEFCRQAVSEFQELRRKPSQGTKADQEEGG